MRFRIAGAVLVLSACNSLSGPDGSLGGTCANLAGPYTGVWVVPQGCSVSTAPFTVRFEQLADGGTLLTDQSAFVVTRGADPCSLSVRHPNLPEQLRYDPLTDSLAGSSMCCSGMCSVKLTR